MNIRVMKRNSIANGERRQPTIDHVLLIKKVMVSSRTGVGRIGTSCRPVPRHAAWNDAHSRLWADLMCRRALMRRGSIVANAGVESRVDHAARPGGRVVMQRPAKPCTPVRFRSWPPSTCNDGATPFSAGQYPIDLAEACPARPAFSGNCPGTRTVQRVVGQASGQ